MKCHDNPFRTSLVHHTGVYVSHLFLHLMATLDRLERQPAFEVVHFQRTAFNKEQVDRYERSFQRAVGTYYEAANVDHTRNSPITSCRTRIRF